jgi:pimeloyl-ACP methyl ester carboxylesterase
MRTVVSFLITVAVAYLALCAWLYAIQRSQIYFPTAETHYPSAQSVRLESQGERLKVWVVPRGGSQALVYFGGNAEDVAGNIDVFSEAFPEHSLYLVNYRGYGGSSGRPSESGLFADALAVYEHVRARHSAIAVMGRSLGSGVAVYLASQRPVARLVLVTAFDSLVNVAREHFRWLPVGLLLRDRYDSTSRARAVTAPVLVVVAGEDEIIPRVRSEALAAAFAPGQAQVRVMPYVTHNALDLAPGYLGAVRSFLEERPGENRSEAP